MEMIQRFDDGSREEIYELLALKDILSFEDLERSDLFWKGVICYREQLWDDALGLFYSARSSTGTDGPVEFYIRRIEQLRSGVAALDWKSAPLSDLTVKRPNYPAAIAAHRRTKAPAASAPQRRRIALWMISRAARRPRAHHRSPPPSIPARAALLHRQALCEISAIRARRHAALRRQQHRDPPAQRTGAFRPLPPSVAASRRSTIGPEDLRIDALIERVKTKRPRSHPRPWRRREGEARQLPRRLLRPHR